MEEEAVGVVGEWLVVVEEEEVVSKGEVKGRALRAKTSPERRMGTRSPKVEVRTSRASRLIGVLEGVERVRGWMVSQSMCRS
jgi:hypothetical protein